MKEQIIKWLEANKINALELSRRSGVKKSTLYNIINGKADPMELGTSKVLALATTMNMSVDELLGSSDIADRKKVLLSDEEMQLLLLWRNASKESRESVLMVLECNQIIKKDKVI